MKLLALEVDLYHHPGKNPQRHDYHKNNEIDLHDLYAFHKYIVSGNLVNHIGKKNRC